MASVRLGWFEAVGHRLRAVVRGRVASFVDDRPDEVEAVSDITQEAMATAAERLDEFRGATEAELVAWVCAIAEKKLCDHRRAVRRQRRDVGRTQSLDLLGDAVLDESEPPDDAASRTDDREFVRRLIDGLPELERIAIRLRYLQERPIAEIASRLYRSEAGAQGVLKRALARLRSRAQALSEAAAEAPAAE